jgi:hypothetical protein
MKKKIVLQKGKSKEPVSEADNLAPLKLFLQRIKVDPRIRAMHISVFMALYELWLNSDGNGEIDIVSHKIMPIAKISSSVTWHRTIKDLHDFGYLIYHPTFNRTKCSKVYLDC